MTKSKLSMSRHRLKNSMAGGMGDSVVSKLGFHNRNNTISPSAMRQKKSNKVLLNRQNTFGSHSRRSNKSLHLKVPG